MFVRLFFKSMSNYPLEKKKYRLKSEQKYVPDKKNREMDRSSYLNCCKGTSDTNQLKITLLLFRWQDQPKKCPHFFDFRYLSSTSFKHRVPSEDDLFFPLNFFLILIHIGWFFTNIFVSLYLLKLYPRFIHVFFSLTVLKWYIFFHKVSFLRIHYRFHRSVYHCVRQEVVPKKNVLNFFYLNDFNKHNRKNTKNTWTT